MALAISTAYTSLLAPEAAERPPGLTAMVAPLIADPRLCPRPPATGSANVVSGVVLEWALH